MFFGGINVYLQQKFALFRHTPWWLDRCSITRPCLDRVSQRGVSVEPAKLGDMTVSMLRGEAGNQRKELEKLVDWLINEVRPDVVHLSNSMMIGMARLIEEHCGPPVVCPLSGEDMFLEKLVAAALRRRPARCCASGPRRSTPSSRSTATTPTSWPTISPSIAAEVHVIPHGLKLDGHGRRIEKRPDEPRVIGYLARICDDKGLHLLGRSVRASWPRATTCRRSCCAPPVILVPAIDLTSSRCKSASPPGRSPDRFEYVGELDRPQKIAFLQSLDVFSVPTVYRESKGLPALEAMANAVPVVLPDHGSFSEMVADTGGGLLCRPHDAADLADKLAELLARSNPRDATGARGSAGDRRPLSRPGHGRANSRPLSPALLTRLAA